MQRKPSVVTILGITQRNRYGTVTGLTVLAPGRGRVDRGLTVMGRAAGGGRVDTGVIVTATSYGGEEYMQVGFCFCYQKTPVTAYYYAAYEYTLIDTKIIFL